jgi:hypothetical protein
VKDLQEHCGKYKLPEQALKWFEQVKMVALVRIITVD